MMHEVSKTYVGIAETITGEKLTISDDPRAEIIAVLDKEFGLIVDKKAAHRRDSEHERGGARAANRERL